MPDVASSTGRLLMIIGIVFLVVGALLASGWKIPLGRLPGDIVIERPGGAFYFPIATCLLLSLLFSLIAWLLRR
jgi:hypothetical protein